MYRKILHIDMDAFYAAVEQRDHPHLRGRPIAVGHGGPRGVVATASYEARPYGVRSALPSTVAKRLCPDLIFVSPRFEVYKEISMQIRDIFYQYTDLVEPLSLDEAFLDVSDHRSATLLAREIKDRIRQTTGLTASAGVSINKMLAKIASDIQKPDGLYVIAPPVIEEFIAQLPIEKFFGIGEVTAKKMHDLGIHNGYDLRQWSEIELIHHFGKAGSQYYGNARGIDDRPVVADRIRKSLGAENTFWTDTDQLSVLKEELERVRVTAWDRMQKQKYFGRTVTVKIKFADFRQITRSRSFTLPIDDYETLKEISESILEEIDLEGNKVRLIGLTVSNAEERQAGWHQLPLPFK